MAIQYRSIVVLSVFSLCMLAPKQICGGKKYSPKNSRITTDLPRNQSSPTLYTNSDDFWNEYNKKENDLLVCINGYTPKEQFEDTLMKLTEFALQYKENVEVANNALAVTKQTMKQSAQTAHDFAEMNYTQMSKIFAFTKKFKNATLEKEILTLWHKYRSDFNTASDVQRYINGTLVKEEYQEISEPNEIGEEDN